MRNRRSPRVRPAEYLGGRFLAALAINIILIFTIPAGLALATKMPYLTGTTVAAALFDAGDFAGAAEATRNALARVDGDTTAEEQAKFWIRLRGKTRLREME